MASWRRGKQQALLHHSDQGSPYTSGHFLDLLKAQGIQCGMSRASEVWDNSAMSSFFSSMKTERIARKVYRTRDDVKASRGTCLTTLSGPSTRRADTRRLGMSVRSSSRRLNAPRLVSMESAAGQIEARAPTSAAAWSSPHWLRPSLSALRRSGVTATLHLYAATLTGRSCAVSIGHGNSLMGGASSYGGAPSRARRWGRADGYWQRRRRRRP